MTNPDRNQAGNSVAKIGDYQLDVQIGSGATGTVWKAHRPGPVTRVVALKRVRVGAGAGGSLDRIRHEATVLTELDHPHIMRILDVVDDLDNDSLALALQYASGGSCEALLAERGKLSAGELVALAAPLADALASAHRKGILHGDVKPANILFTSDGEPLLGDFGVARALGASTDGQITGSASYLAPELLDGGVPDPRADLYSLAVVCYEALAGHSPFEGAVPLAVLRAADAGHHQPLTEVSGVPERLADVVELAMDRDPGRRFASGEDFAASLRSSVSPEQVRLPGPASAPSLTSLDDATSATDTYGPRPPQPEPPRERLLPKLLAAGLRPLKGLSRSLAKGLQHRPILTAGLGAALLLVVLGVVLGSVLSGGDGDAAGGAACPDTAAPDLNPEAQLVRGDTDGDGCETYGIYELRDLPGGYQEMVLTFTLESAERYMILGDAGDQLFFGDWYCQGFDTPGLYRTTEGEVHYFDSWPDEAGEGHTPAHIEPEVPAGGAAEVIPGGSAAEGHRCDRIRVVDG